MTDVFSRVSGLIACGITAAVICSPQVGECAIDPGKVNSLQINADGGVVPVPAGGKGADISKDGSDTAFDSEIANGVLEALIGPIDTSRVGEGLFGGTSGPPPDDGFGDAFAQIFRFLPLDSGFIVEQNDLTTAAAFAGVPIETVASDAPLSEDSRDKALEALLDGIGSAGIENLDDQSLLEAALILGQNFGDKQLEGEPEVRKFGIDKLKRELVREFNKRKRRGFARRLENLIGPPSDQGALARAARIQNVLNDRPGISTGLFGLGHNANQNGVDGLGPEVDNFDVLKNDSYVNAATIPQTPAGGGQTFFGPFILNPGVNGASINVNDVIYNFYFNGTNIVTVP